MQLVTFAIFSYIARLRSERGQDLLEYAMLGGLLAAAIAVIAVVFNGAVANMADGIAACIDFQPGGCTGGL